MDFGARIGRFNKWMMLVVYPFYLYLVSVVLSCNTSRLGVTDTAVKSAKNDQLFFRGKRCSLCNRGCKLSTYAWCETITHESTEGVLI